MDSQALVGGYAAYASAEEIVAGAEAPAASITITVTSSQGCISAASAISAVSVGNTFEHGC